MQILVFQRELDRLLLFTSEDSKKTSLRIADTRFARYASENCR